jgi:hypothetical protein
LDTGDVYVVTVFSEQTTEGGDVMVVPRDCVFGEHIAHSTFIVIFVVRAAVIAAVVTPIRVAIYVTIAGRLIAIAIVTIPVSVAGVVGGIRILRIYGGSVWVVAPVPTPPETPPPWRGEVADKDDFVEMLEATKPIVSIKVSIVETVKASKAQG